MGGLGFQQSPLTGQTYLQLSAHKLKSVRSRICTQGFPPALEDLVTHKLLAITILRGMAQHKGN